MDAEEKEGGNGVKTNGHSSEAGFLQQLDGPSCAACRSIMMRSGA